MQDVPAGGGQLDIASAAACFTWNVARAGRGRFGRTFLPGISPSSYSNGGLLSDPPASSWQGEANDFLANVNQESTSMFPVCKLVVPHQRENGAWLPVTQLEPVVSVRLSPVVATQRRRLTALQKL